MTPAKRKEWVEAIRTAELCGVLAGFISTTLPLDTLGQIGVAFLAAAASFAWDYRLLRGGKGG